MSEGLLAVVVKHAGVQPISEHVSNLTLLATMHIRFLHK
jgi:hypothetical protein